VNGVSLNLRLQFGEGPPSHDDGYTMSAAKTAIFSQLMNVKVDRGFILRISGTPGWEGMSRPRVLGCEARLARLF